jgi:hypothetical protein
MSNVFRVCALLGFVLVLPTVAQADLILLGTTGTLGSGLGSVETVLTLNSPGNTSNAAGSVTCDATLANGCLDVVVGDTTAINATRSFADAEITQASEFRLIFNAGENDGSITVNSLSAFFYNSLGDLYHTATLQGTPTVFFGDFNGTGAQGIVFGLNGAQQLIVQSQFNAANRIGVAASLSGATGGLDTFNVSMARGDDVVPSPEPAVMALFGMGLFALGFRARRKKIQQG